MGRPNHFGDLNEMVGGAEMPIDFDRLLISPLVAHLGQAARYQPPGEADWHDTRAVFDEAHEFVELQGEVPISTTSPAAFVRLADLPAGAPEQGGLLEVAGRAWRITDVQPDGAGGALLPLHGSETQ